jgi:hypothetical protein
MLLTIGALALVLAGCGVNNAAGVGTSAPAPTAPAPQEEATVPISDPSAAAMAELARSELATRLGVPTADIAVLSAEAVEWSDGSLGCPQPGSMYPQVITPGYRVTLRHSGQTYSYHTDMSRIAVPCE